MNDLGKKKTNKQNSPSLTRKLIFKKAYAKQNCKFVIIIF